MASRPPADLSRFIAELAQTLASGRIPYMLIGGQAVLVHGRPRLTEDIDITLGADPGRLPDLLALCDTVRLRPLPADVPRFVKETFVLPARHDATGLRVDFIFSTTPYERQAIARAVAVEVGGVAVAFASAEDLILHKLFAGRARDVEDVQSVVRRNRATLDWGYLEQWARQFANVPGREDMPARVERLRAAPEA